MENKLGQLKRDKPTKPKQTKTKAKNVFFTTTSLGKSSSTK